MVYVFFDEKTSGSGIKNKNISRQELSGELHKPIITKFEKRKVHSPLNYVLLIFSVNRYGLFI